MVMKLVILLVLASVCHAQFRPLLRGSGAHADVVASIAGSTTTSPHLSGTFVMQPGYQYLAFTYHSGASGVQTNLVGSSHTSPTWSIISSNSNVATYTSVWLGTTTANSSGVVSNICAGDTGGGVLVLRCTGLTNAGTRLVQEKKTTNTTANPSVTFDAAPYAQKRNLVFFSVVTANNGSTTTPASSWASVELADGGSYNSPATSYRVYFQRRGDDASLALTDATTANWAGLAVELRAQ